MQCNLQNLALTWTEPKVFIRNMQVAVTAERHAGRKIQFASNGLFVSEQVDAHDVAGSRRRTVQQIGHLQYVQLAVAHREAQHSCEARHQLRESAVHARVLNQNDLTLTLCIRSIRGT